MLTCIQKRRIVIKVPPISSYISWRQGMHKKRKLIVHKGYQLKKAVITGLLVLLVSVAGLTIVIFLSYQNSLLVTVVVSLLFSIVLSCVVFFYTLKHTSGVSGQMILLGNYLDLMNEGINPEIRPLRNNDSFHDVFEKLAVYLKNRP